MSGPDPVLAALAPWLDPARGGNALLAVSGGPDSTALMHAAALLDGRVQVATVDHGLRFGSAAEAEAVARAARSLGLPHATLAWTGEKPAAGLQDAARAARYRLLAAQARRAGADLVLTGHTRDDQAETVLLRLAAGSGLAGLAGMRAERTLAPGLRLGRPFLGLPKAILVAWCEARGIAYLRDPSNGQPRFARARLRAARSALEAEGLTAARLARLAERAARDEAALAAAAEAALAAMLVAETHPGAPLRLDGAMLAGLPEAVALRCLDRAMDRAGAAPRRLERLEALVLGALLPALRRGEGVRRTLGGLLVAADARRVVTLAPAPPRGVLAPGPTPRGAGVAAGGPELLGKGKAPAYIEEACSEAPAMPDGRAIWGTARARD